MRNLIRSVLIELQQRFVPFPGSFRLVSGCPRSGTSAMSSWIGSQPRVKSFAETKILFATHQLRKALCQWERFPEKDISERIRRFACQSYALEGVYLGARTLLEKEPLDPISISPDEYRSFLTSVELAFPSARFVIMVRNPESVVSSIVSREWGFSRRGKKGQERSVRDGIEVWKKANQFAASIAQEEHVYLCRFEDLIDQPEEESRGLAQFLGLEHWEAFEPRKTSEVTLSPEESDRVWNETRDCRGQLAEAGISYERKLRHR